MSRRSETIADLLLDRLGDHRPGLRSRERTWTWDEVVRDSAARSARLRQLRDEDRPFHVGVLLDNVPEFVLWLGAAALAGATVVGINPTRRGAYLEAEVRHTDLQLLVTDSAGLELLDGLDIGVPRDRFILVDSPEYAEQLPPGEPVRDPSISAETRMLLLFTSGTTGASKAAICSQGRLVGLARQNTVKYHIGRDDVCYCCMPLFHGNALMALWAPALLAGACVALAPKFSASGFMPDVRHYGATYFTYVGKAIGYLLGQPERPDDADNTLTHGFGTEASPEDRAEFKRRFGAVLYEGYGSSEGAGMINQAPSGPPSALGVPAHAGVRVVDPETREPCPPAELDEHGRVRNAEEAIGELVNTEGAAKFEGYYKNPAANAERVRHGWYWTGDLGYLDSAGYLYFAGRSGDWIRVDGENISALLTERILRRHPDILAAGVFAVPDPRSGDQVMAAVETRARFEDLNLPDFLAAQEDLGPKGIPRYVRVSRQLPTTGSNKLRKKEMQADGWRTTDEVHWWPGRGAPLYARMTEQDKQDLREQFATNGRLRFLP
ncbi:fatty-acyl-CoA synthase [Saccharopolyspora antimicrobica]|uniref:Fatty-acyl-CoA synthase n=1 Tax=Saccharopolyspora antimicrobica TaxID=455193 RepID=A0A1I4WA06_9PSEU|nr:AMP-binding protein [Saccharopolyspora antimicrobica]RKT87015.1 fatty-acyl-CoA synthase [Saccharopolyspora antimicrobica]SFN09789.1 fatty-acyl-CoA synthase [Saccharopolyspora antimicrobica]